MAKGRLLEETAETERERRALQTLGTIWPRRLLWLHGYQRVQFMEARKKRSGTGWSGRLTAISCLETLVYVRQRQGAIERLNSFSVANNASFDVCTRRRVACRLPFEASTFCQSKFTSASRHSKRTDMSRKGHSYPLSRACEEGVCVASDLLLGHCIIEALLQLRETCLNPR